MGWGGVRHRSEEPSAATEIDDHIRTDTIGDGPEVVVIWAIGIVHVAQRSETRVGRLHQQSNVSTTRLSSKDELGKPTKNDHRSIRCQASHGAYRRARSKTAPERRRSVSAGASSNRPVRDPAGHRRATRSVFAERRGRRVHSVRGNRWMEAGERMFLWCQGGPSLGRATHFPPPLEIEVEGAVYVLVDDGPPEQWHYAYVERRLLIGARHSCDAEGLVEQAPRRDRGRSDRCRNLMMFANHYRTYVRFVTF